MMVAWWNKRVRLVVLLCASVSLMAMQAVHILLKEGDELLVVLEWKSPVDLDLFVTGPDGETIYFGNRTARSGHKMDKESDCHSKVLPEGIYRETASIPVAMPGRYRVSVDYILDCNTGFTEAGANIYLKDMKTDTVLGHVETKVNRKELTTVAWEFEVKKR